MSSELIRECLLVDNILRILFNGDSDSHYNAFSIQTLNFHLRSHAKVERAFYEFGLWNEKGFTDIDTIEEMFRPFPCLPYYDEDSRIHSVYIILEEKKAFFHCAARGFYEIRKIIGDFCGIQDGNRVSFSLWLDMKIPAMPNSEAKISRGDTSNIIYREFHSVFNTLVANQSLSSLIPKENYEEALAICRKEIENMRVMWTYFN